jgi:hypothetical protein
VAFSGALAATAIAITLAAVAVALPYAPWAQPLGFILLPAEFLAFVGAATLTYLRLVERVDRPALAPASPYPAHPVLELHDKKRKEVP